jgi:hypothetical protein
VENSAPVVQVLRPERLIVAVLVAQGADVGRGCALAEHLEDGVAGNQVNEQKNERDHQPDNRKSEKKAS